MIQFKNQVMVKNVNSNLTNDSQPSNYQDDLEEFEYKLDQLNDPLEKKEPYDYNKILFPYEEIRLGQNSLIDDVKELIKNENTLIAHAPTGLGKTVSALSVLIPYALENKKKVFFLTNRHTQHKIAVDTLKEIKKIFGEKIVCIDLIGKKGMCNQEVAGLFGSEFNEYCKTIVNKGECEYYNNVYKQKKELSTEAKFKLIKLNQDSPLGNEEFQNSCRDGNFCSYEMALSMSKNANVLIGDYNYIFNSIVSGVILQKLGVSIEDIILVVDEGHNLPNRITSMLSSNLTSNMLKNSLQEAKKFGYDDVGINLENLNQILIKLGSFHEMNDFNNSVNTFKSKEKIITKDQLISEIKKVVDYDYLLDELSNAAEEVRKKQKKSFIGGVVTFLESWLGTDDGFIRFVSEQEGRFGKYLSLQYACLDPSVISSSIFRDVHSAILMSGTLEPTGMYKNLLGIKDCVEKIYPSPFPLENRLSLVIPETSTKFNLRGEKMFISIANHCAKIITQVPGNIALFFPSYNLRDKISYHLEREISKKKIFWEKQEMNKKEKEDLLSDFKKNSFPGSVLLGVTGANFAEGIDFPGDLLKAVVVIGLPLGRPDLKTREMIAYYDLKFGKGWSYAYTNPAMNKCIQSAGRCIRSEKDRGAIIYLEERFAWKNYFDCLPKEGLIVTKDYNSYLKQFFS